MTDLLDQNPTSKPLTYRWYILLVWFTLFLIGGLFREMHWPFASVIRVGASAAFTAFAITQVFGFGFKKWLNTVALALSIAWIVWIITGAMFRGGYPFNWKGVSFFGLFLLGFTIWSAAFLAVRIHRSKRGKG